MVYACQLKTYDAGRVRGEAQYNADLRWKLRGRAAQQMARVDSLSKSLMLNGSRQYYFTKSIRIPDVDHKVRVVILWGKPFLDMKMGKLYVTKVVVSGREMTL